MKIRLWGRLREAEKQAKVAERMLHLGWEAGGVTAKEIALDAGLSRSYVTATLAVWEINGYIDGRDTWRTGQREVAYIVADHQELLSIVKRKVWV